MKEISKKIFNMIFNEIIGELNISGHEADNWLESRNCVFIKANKSTRDYNFEVFIRFYNLTHLIKADVYCLSPVQEDRIVFCLKLFNYWAVWEDNTKYNLCPKNHTMMCKTYNFLDTFRISIGEALTNQLDWSIDNLKMVYMAIEKNDIRDLIKDIHPIHFHNYLFH